MLLHALEAFEPGPSAHPHHHVCVCLAACRTFCLEGYCGIIRSFAGIPIAQTQWVKRQWSLVIKGHQASKAWLGCCEPVLVLTNGILQVFYHQLLEQSSEVDQVLITTIIFLALLED